MIVVVVVVAKASGGGGVVGGEWVVHVGCFHWYCSVGLPRADAMILSTRHDVVFACAGGLAVLENKTVRRN